MSTIIDGSAGVTTNTGAVYNSIQSATAQASTSGTSIDFTSIPSWVKRITVMFNGVSLAGAGSNQLVQIGSGSVSSSGYSSLGASGYNTSQYVVISSTAGFIIYNNQVAAAINGTVVLTLVSANTWVCNGNLSNITAAIPATYSVSGSSPALGGTLDRVRITTVNGTDTFDAGSINILYE